jgi:uncharacterized membrane protein
MSYQPPVTFKRKAVEPIACIKDGWNLIKDNYWLFVGITLLAMIIGGLVPIVLIGPMMCGVFLCLFRRMRGEPIEFGLLFQGFEYFGPSLIATFLHMVPIIAILVPFYIGIFMVPFLLAVTQHNGEPNPFVGILMFALIAALALVMILVMIIVNIAFTFVYALIVDRKLQGLDAVKLSLKGGLANFWQLLGLMLLLALLGIGGALLCYVGFFLVLPIHLASLSVAYTQVFGLGNVQQQRPPPPPVFT